MTSALLVVAHPDDEAIFAGNLLAGSTWSWDILTLTGLGTTRGERLKVCLDRLESWGTEIGNYGLGNLPDVLLPEGDWWARACAELDSAPRKYDIVLTHNRRGDYGHPAHSTVWSAADQIFGPLVWEFVCPAPSGVGPQFAGDQGVRQVTIPEGNPKLELLQEAYPYAWSVVQKDRPDLAAWIKDGVEFFTADSDHVLWPE